MSTLRTKSIVLRTSPETKQAISDAAAIMGTSISRFVEEAVVERAQLVLPREPLVLNDLERDRFLAALANPPEPPPKMREAAESAMRAVREGIPPS
jgi:uncharacterized protein (DUF1778 family)